MNTVYCILFTDYCFQLGWSSNGKTLLLQSRNAGSIPALSTTLLVRDTVHKTKLRDLATGQCLAPPQIPVAQWTEHFLAEEKAVGSSPARDIVHYQPR